MLLYVYMLLYMLLYTLLYMLLYMLLYIAALHRCSHIHLLVRCCPNKQLIRESAPFT